MDKFNLKLPATHLRKQKSMGGQTFPSAPAVMQRQERTFPQVESTC